MYRERLVATEVQSENAHRLKRLLLEYHDFRQLKAASPLLDDTRRIADWQAERLKTTHQDLYRHPGYHTGLEFLLADLYAPAGMTRRDDNIDRVFPKMVKWLPDHLLATFAGLVELNLLTQSLDLELAEWFDRQGISDNRLDHPSKLVRRLPGQRATSGTAPATGAGFRYRPTAGPLCTQPHTGLAAVDDPGAGGNGGTGRFAQLFAPGLQRFPENEQGGSVD